MKPPICEACGESFAQGGDLVRFADYQPLPDGVTGHPHGLEWFCAKHLPQTRALAHLPSREAAQKIRLRKGLSLQ